jgi:hypothetical protein
VATAPGRLEDQSVEMRFMTPRIVADVLDAISGSRRVSRADLTNLILAEWVQARLHEAMLIERVTRGNPALREAPWKPTES